MDPNLLWETRGVSVQLQAMRGAVLACIVLALMLGTYGISSAPTRTANRLGLRRERISLARSLDAIVYDVIDDAEMKSYSA